MLLRKMFEEGLEEIEIAFKNFEMTKRRADIWYKYCKDLTNDNWNKKIKNCIRFCRKIPTLADILDLSGYYKKEDDWSEVKIFEDDYKHTNRPEKITKEVYEILSKADPKYRDKLNKLGKE